MSKGNVYANKRSVVHEGDGLKNICMVPDVCKTPTPGGPAPVPYINIAMDSDLVKGTKTVRIAGNKVATTKSNISKSTGDEPGKIGGVVSNTNKGKMAWTTSSPNVKYEGKSVIRFMDLTLHNGNTYNAAWTQPGLTSPTGYAYGDDDACGLCGKSTNSDKHRLHETNEAADKLTKLLTEMSNIGNQKDKTYKTDFDNERAALNTAKNMKAKSNAEKDIKRTKISEAIDKLNNTVQSIQNNGIYRCTSPDLPPRGSDMITAAYKPKYNYGKGYMVGVLICKCEQVFATTSGLPPKGFQHAVNHVSYQYVGGENAFQYSGQEIAVNDAWNPEVADLKKNGKNYKAQQKGLIQSIETAEFQRKQLHSQGNAGYQTSVGNCAAPKLLQHAYENGHVPKSMSEKWFCDPGGKTVKVAHHRTDKQGNGRMVSESDPQAEFKHGDTVPSCNTCKISVPPMLCNVDDYNC